MVSMSRNQIPIFLIRLFAGFCMFFAGLEKATYRYWGGHTTGFTVALQNDGGGIFHNWFQSITTTNWISPLVYTGELCIGIAILLGLTLRWACYCGIVENGLFWASEYMDKNATTHVVNTGTFGLGWSSGPLELNAAMITFYITLIIVGAGYKWGIDGYLNKLNAVKKNRVIRVFLG